MRPTRLLFSLFLTVLLAVASLPIAAAAPPAGMSSAGLPTAKVQIDGQIMPFTGYIVNNSTMVPLRAIFQALGATVNWDPVNYTITATKGTSEIFLAVGQYEARVNGQPTTLTAVPVLIDNSTFVPLRFVATALGAEVGWDPASYTAIIKSPGAPTSPGPVGEEGVDCSIQPYLVHETINPMGETWGRCGSPHVVRGELRIEGPSSPILTIEKGAVVHFEEGAKIIVGQNAQGGLKIAGTEQLPVLLTANTPEPAPGHWEGIYFGPQTLQSTSSIEWAKIEFAGADDGGAVVLNGREKPIELLMKNVTIDKSAYAGLNLKGQARLKAGSENLTITGTVVTPGGGGFPIITNPYGSHNLPKGTYRPNAVNAVNINDAWGGFAEFTTNTTWKNIGVPYAVEDLFWIQGPTAPTLTIEPGVIALFADGAGFNVGAHAAGKLVAVSEGVTKQDLALGFELPNASAMADECPKCEQNKAIVLGAWSHSPAKDFWDGIHFMVFAGRESKLVGTVVAWGGTGYDRGTITVGDYSFQPVQIQLANSIVQGGTVAGLMLYEGGELASGSTGNQFTGSRVPVHASVNAIGSLSDENDYTGNDTDVVMVDTGPNFTVRATWKDLNVPYRTTGSLFIGGPWDSSLTLEPGVTIQFAGDAELNVGIESGSLAAMGTPDNPVTFTGINPRPGFWRGIRVEPNVGVIMLNGAIIEYADNGVTIVEEVGRFINSSTIRNNRGWGIYREGGVTTSHVTEDNTFENNGLGDENEVY